MLAWAGVAHSSGSGWVQAVGALLAAVLVIGLVAPIVPARRAPRVTCTRLPSDGQAGRTVAVTMEASGPIRIRPRQPVGPVARADGTGPRGRDGRGDTRPRPARGPRRGGRGGGLLRALRAVVVGPRDLGAAPPAAARGPEARRTGSPAVPRPESSIGDAPLRIPSGAGEPRGVRPYRPGDTRRSVHWPATSHVGSLMVRENERQTDDPVVVELVLPADPVGRRGRIGAGHGRRSPTTWPAAGRWCSAPLEADGHVIRVVRDRIDLGRRLARAVGSPAGAAGPRGPSPTAEAARRRGPS